jgi:hypothetical protein
MTPKAGVQEGGPRLCEGAPYRGQGAAASLEDLKTSLNLSKIFLMQLHHRIFH